MVKLKLKNTIPQPWQLGTTDDALFILDHEPSASGKVKDGPQEKQVVLNIAKLPMEYALPVVVEHNGIVTAWMDLYMRYLGALKLLEEASPYVEDELREQIIMCHQHAEESHPDRLKHKMLLRRSCIEVKG